MFLEKPIIEITWYYFKKGRISYMESSRFPLPVLISALRIVSMTTARSELIDRENGGFHHIITRCVRRAWLCDLDPLTGRDHSHRKRWIEESLLRLCDAFAVRVYSYAVMANHCHIVLEYRPQDAKILSDEEVARRWLLVFPPRREELLEASMQALLADPGRIQDLRERLGDLSWYMKCLNEPIARRANREDDCTGKFWESRFHSSRPFKSLSAVYACMTYVDLNPLRAGACNRVGDQFDFTALRRRLEEASHDRAKKAAIIEPMRIDRASGRIFSTGSSRLSLTLEGYLAHVDWMVERDNCMHREFVGPRLGAPPVLLDPESFLGVLDKLRRRWGRKLGHSDARLSEHLVQRPADSNVSG